MRSGSVVPALLLALGVVSCVPPVWASANAGAWGTFSIWEGQQIGPGYQVRVMANANASVQAQVAGTDDPDGNPRTAEITAAESLAGGCATATGLGANHSRAARRAQGTGSASGAGASVSINTSATCGSECSDVATVEDEGFHQAMCITYASANWQQTGGGDVKSSGHPTEPVRRNYKVVLPQPPPGGEGHDFGGVLAPDEISS